MLKLEKREILQYPSLIKGKAIAKLGEKQITKNLWMRKLFKR